MMIQVGQAVALGKPMNFSQADSANCRKNLKIALTLRALL